MVAGVTFTSRTDHHFSASEQVKNRQGGIPSRSALSAKVNQARGSSRTDKHLILPLTKVTNRSSFNGLRAPWNWVFATAQRNSSPWTIRARAFPAIHNLRHLRPSRMTVLIHRIWEIARPGRTGSSRQGLRFPVTGEDPYPSKPLCRRL